MTVPELMLYSRLEDEIYDRARDICRDLDMLYKADVKFYLDYDVKNTIRMRIFDCEDDEVDYITMSFEDFASDDYIHIARKIRNEDKAKRKKAEQEAKKQKELEEKETRRQMYEQLKKEFEND